MMCLRLLCSAGIAALACIVAVIISEEPPTTDICDRIYTPNDDESFIGKGGHGRVSKGYDFDYSNMEHPPYAVKEFTYPEDFTKEYDTLRQLNLQFDKLPTADKDERRFSTLYGFCELQIITDYMPRGILTDDNTVTADVDRIYGLAMAVSQIHSLGFVHLDLKPENVRISFEGVVKLIDFGTAEDLWAPKSGTNLPLEGSGYILEATPTYTPPEVLRKALIPNSQKWHVDTWGVGTIAYEMLSRQRFSSGNCFRIWNFCFSDGADARISDDQFWVGNDKILYILIKHALAQAANETYNDAKVNVFSRLKNAYSRWSKAMKPAKDAYINDEEQAYLNPENKTLTDNLVKLCSRRCYMKSPRKVLFREMSNRVKRDQMASESAGWKPDIVSLMVGLIFDKLLQFLPRDRASMSSVVEEMKTFWQGRAEPNAKPRYLSQNNIVSQGIA